VTITAVLSAVPLTGGLGPPIGLVSGPGPIDFGLFFSVLPLAGLWLITAGLRQRRADRIAPLS
jgi:hypothetical protein